MKPADLLAISREPNVAAFLRVIRACEGTAGDNGYRMHFGGDLFDTFAGHPRKLIIRSGYRSTAAGAYQFLERTWDGIRTQYGIPDFTPSMQDAGAVALLIRRKALDAVRAGRLDEAVELTNDEWASLPGSPYGQPTRDMAFVRKVFAMHGGVENVTEQSPAPIEQRTFPPAPPAPQPESKPMAPAITVLGALLPSLVNLIPELGKLFGSGSAVAERNVAAAEKVAEVVVAATRAPNLQGAIETMQSDPAALEAARDAVRREWFDLQEKSIQQRQEFVMRYQAQTNVRTVIGRLTFVEALSVWLAVSGTLAGWYVLWAGEEKFGNQIIGSVVTLLVIGGVVAVRDFWIGTSVESRRKTDMLAERDAPR